MDATQLINDSILESEEEEENNDRGDPLGKLCILKNQHIPEKECLLFLGDNVLGRDPSTCSLSLPASSVSKQHATISLSVYRRKGCKDQVEALLWDMGSMNGTRKGHLKLTPHVRYALSEGDSLVLADISCKYTKCSIDLPNIRTPATASNFKTRDVLRENGENLNTSNTQSPAETINKHALADVEDSLGTPARMGGLSYEQTPTQPESSLVPDSESESEDDKIRAADRRQRTVVSESDSYKSSPTCSTFLSPTNKVVPESEDESPITPSSSYKNRTRRVSFNTSDGDIIRQEQKKIEELDIVDDSEEDDGNDMTSMENGNAQPELSKVQPTAGIQTNATSEFSMDSDTDVDEEENVTSTTTSTTTTATAATTTTTTTTIIESSNTQASEKTEFHTDSDTDVEDAVSYDDVPQNSKTIPVAQPKAISVNSDTDLEEVDVSNAAEFNLDSDTDVEDEDLTSAAAKATESTNVKVPKTSVNPNDINKDSDTDVDEGESDISAASMQIDAKPAKSRSPTSQNSQLDNGTHKEPLLECSPASKPLEDLEILSNSDTDVEDDSLDVKPTKSVPIVTDCKVDGVGVSEPIVSLNSEDKPTAVSDSDTDAEDNIDTIPVLQREITPHIQGALLNCSTPIQQQEGNIEELETQAFLCPSISAYRSAVALLRPAASPSQEEDYTVAETQSFLLNDKSQDPNISVDSDSSVNERDMSQTYSGGNLQLELSDSSALQCQAQALTMEATQAFIHANLEETQPYADLIVPGEKNKPVDFALQETQAYIPMQDSDEDEESAEVGQEGALSGKQDEFGKEDEATQPLELLSVAATQPICIDEESESESEESALVVKKTKQSDQAKTQRFLSVALAPTQPMEIQEDSETDDDCAVSNQENEENTQPNSNISLAQTVPMNVSEVGANNEESALYGKAKTHTLETQQHLDLTVAQTLPIEMLDDSKSNNDSAVFRETKVTNIQEEEAQKTSDIIVSQTVPMEVPEDIEETEHVGSAKLWSKEAATQSIERPKNDSTDEEDPGLVFRKRKSKPITTIEDTQPSLESEITVVSRPPIPTDKENDSEDSIPVRGNRTSRKQKRKVNSKPQVAPTQPAALSEDDDDDVIPAPRKRKARKLEDTQSLDPQIDTEVANNDEDLSDAGGKARRGRTNKTKPPVAPTQPAALSEEEDDDDNVIGAPRKRKARKLEDTQSLDSQIDTEVAKDDRVAGDAGGKAGRGRTNEIEEVFEEVSGEPTKRQTRGKGKGVQVSKGRRTRAKVETEEEEENKMADKLPKENEEKEVRGTRERLERERIEQEEMAARFQKEREEKERERLEKEQEIERLEKERVERENEELSAKLQKETERKEKEAEERLEKERQATELMEKEEQRQKEKERLEREKMAQEEKEKAEKDRLEVARKQKEELQRQDKKEQLEKGKQNEEGPRRGRRTGRRTIAVPESTAVDEDDVPARRTRSRSNSSNSVNSEISASSNVSQTSRGRGRGRGGRKTEVQVQKASPRGRRRTAAAPEVYVPSPPRTLSRSNSNISLSSELSVSSISSTSRNRGGRAGKKADIECAKEQASSQKEMPRGRKSTRICPDANEDKGDNIQPPVSTRGKRGAKENSTKCEESQGKDPSTSIAEKRGGRTNQAQTKKELDGKRLETNDNEKDTKKAAARNTPARKSMKVTLEETKSNKPKGRGRASVLAKSPDERSGSGSSGNDSMEQEQPPQTPRSSVSRKRSSADSESDVFPKTPRSCTASPSTGRSRTPTQAYRVLFTGMVDEDGERVLTRLGGTIAKDVVVMNCLVTDKVRRTVKFLCAVAKGIPIVTTQWLEKSGKAGTLLLPSSYLVKDREQENKFDFNLQESLRVASNQPFLKGYEIHVTKSVKPEPVHMKDIISCSGAVFLPRMPSSNKPNTVVVSCEEDWSLCAPAVSCGLPIVTSEFILTGILQQKLDLDSHKLSGPVPAPTTAAAVRGRGRKKS